MSANHDSTRYSRNNSVGARSIGMKGLGASLRVGCARFSRRRQWPGPLYGGLEGDAGSCLKAQRQGGLTDYTAPDKDEPRATRIGLIGGRPPAVPFDATGRGVYANDDFFGEFGFQSNLPAGDALTPSAGGVYYLAISGYANRPVSQGGDIFGGGSFPILAPDGPGGGFPVTGWNDQGFVWETTGQVIVPDRHRPCLRHERPMQERWLAKLRHHLQEQGDCVGSSRQTRNLPRWLG